MLVGITVVIICLMSGVIMGVLISRAEIMEEHRDAVLWDEDEKEKEKEEPTC